MLQLPCLHACQRPFIGSKVGNLSSRNLWARQKSLWPGAQHSSVHPLDCVRTDTSVATKDAQTAEAAVDAGLQKLKQKKWDAALQLFERGLQVGQHGLATAGLKFSPFSWHWQACSQHGAFVQLNPSQDEARAALYNKGCCHAQMEQWAEAAEAVQQACNNYGLRLAVAIEASCAMQRQQGVCKCSQGPSRAAAQALVALPELQLPTLIYTCRTLI